MDLVPLYNHLKINDKFYFNFHFELKQNKNEEEVITFKDIHFDVIKIGKQELILDKATFVEQLKSSKIFIHGFRSLNQYSISSMILPWFDQIITMSDKNLKSFLISLLYKIVLRIVHYYYYIESAEDFIILTDVILDKTNVSKILKGLFFKKDTEEDGTKIMQHLFSKRISGTYSLNIDIFDLINKNDNIDEKYSNLFKVFKYI
jgi:hypothetical protein